MKEETPKYKYTYKYNGSVQVSVPGAGTFDPSQTKGTNIKINNSDFEEIKEENKEEKKKEK